jgi:predicted PurR-regulated permease PerM
MVQNGLKRLRYAAGSINLFGLMLSAGTWAFDVWFHKHTPSGRYLAFSWTLGVFCWILGLFLFIAAWVAESCSGSRWGAGS